jgi:hypothetical protein
MARAAPSRDAGEGARDFNPAHPFGWGGNFRFTHLSGA